MLTKRFRIFYYVDVDFDEKEESLESVIESIKEELSTSEYPPLTALGADVQEVNKI